MKKIIAHFFVLLGLLSLSSFAVAESTITLTGNGTAADAIRAFHKAVAYNRGTIDRNAETEISSAGDIGQFQAQLYLEVGKDTVNIRVAVHVKKESIWNIVAGSQEQELAAKIEASLKQSGYHD